MVLDAITVAQAVAGDDAGELVPIDRTDAVVTAFGIPGEFRIGNGEPQVVGLRHGLVDELVP
jgi:hypothetical protein